MDKLKLKFFSWHVSVSLLVVSSISLLCLLYWFPDPFLILDGTWIALLIMAGIDIIIGPLLTLLLVSSRKTKRAILIDMMSILLVQLFALTYGVTQIKSEQVVAMVHFDNIFHLVTNKEMSNSPFFVDTKLPKYNGITYAMVLSKDIAIHMKKSKRLIVYSPERYLSLANEELVKHSIAYKKVPLQIQEKYNSSYIFKSVIGKNRNAYVVLDDKMKIVDIILK